MTKFNKLKFALVLLSLICFSSCTSEDIILTKNEYFRNASSQAVIVETYFRNSKILQDTIEANETLFLCTYQIGDVNPMSIRCQDSVIFTFPNGKEYICGLLDRTKCFSNSRSPLEGSNSLGFPNTSGDDFVFTITEENYLNARDLD